MNKNIKNYRANDFWNRLLSRNLNKLFLRELNELEKKIVFKEFVEVINLETSTQCNRHCVYCPLSIYDRGISNNSMNQFLFDKIISELIEIDYDGLISLNLYNEPLLNKELENQIQNIKKKLPNCFISFNSNGDYLSLDRLKSLYESGVDEIRITLHNNIWHDNNRKNAIEKFFNKLNLDYKIQKYIPNETIQVERSFYSMNLIVMCHNWSKVGNNRTGSVDLLVKDFKNRNNPCMKPFRELVISAEGNCYPCCNFFPNSEISRNFLIGNVSSQSIYNIFSSEIMVNFRKNLFDFSPKFFPCNTCNDTDNSSMDSDKVRKLILENILKKK